MYIEFKDYYNEIKTDIAEFLESQVSSQFPWKSHLILAPDLFLLICKLSQETELPIQDKAHLSGALAYFVSPMDFIPEETEGMRGYLDDVILSAVVLNDILESQSKQFIIDHWTLHQEPKTLFQSILVDAEEMIGKEIYSSLLTLARS